MSLKIIKIDPKVARIAFAVAAIICIAAAYLTVRWHFANVVATRLDAERPESKIVADWLVSIAPNDPQTHFAAAAILERTFDTGDLERSLAEYEKAASLSPDDFRLWLHIARARSLVDDIAGAEAAFRRAAELAPNYTAVNWAYGNFLVRQGSFDEGFAMLARAAERNADYSRAAVTTAMQIFDGSIADTRRVLGDTESTNASLALYLAAEKRFAEAADAWSRVNTGDKKRIVDGEKLLSQFITEKQYRAAAGMYADLNPQSETPVIGQLTNGGFESEVKLRNAGLFEWNLGEGVHPQIGLSEAQKRGGRFSLAMAFSTFESSGFRVLSQTVAVEPGAVYEFEGFYRFDMKSTAKFKFEIADLVTGVIGATEPFAMAGDWTTMRARFTVPAVSDGVIIRFVREGCSGPTCPMNGRIFLDDLSLRRL